MINYESNTIMKANRRLLSSPDRSENNDNSFNYQGLAAMREDRSMTGIRLSTTKNSNSSFTFNKPLTCANMGPKFVTNKYKLSIAKRGSGGGTGRPPLAGTRNNNYMMSGEMAIMPKNMQQKDC